MKIIVLVVFSVLFTGWGNLFVHANECDELRLRLPQLQGAELVAAYEQLYYCSQDSDDVDYQLSCLSDYVAEARRQGMKDEEAFALAQRATLFYNYDMNDSIFQALPQYMERMRQLGNMTHLYEMWSQIAYTYIFMNQNRKGLTETETMYADAKANNDLFGMGLAYSIMGTAYSNLRSFNESIDAFQKAVDILSSLTPLPPVLPDVYTYYGNALNDMKDYTALERLIENWKAMLDCFVEQHQLEGTPTADLYLSYYYSACVQAKLAQGKLQEAESLMEESREHIKEMESYSGMQWIFFMAQLRLMQGKYTEALDYNTRRLQLLEQNSDKSDHVKVLQQRAEIMQHLGHYEEAANLYRAVYVISDSLNAQDTKDKLNEMNTIYQLDEKQMENERLQMENERARFRYIIIIVSVTVLALAVFLFFRIRSARRLKQAHGELQTAYADLKEANEVIEQTTAAKERIESELRIARDIQQSMVPTVFPDRPDLDLYASMTPAKEVGGDLYGYFLNEEEDKLYFALGDVSGKGVPASLFMAQATRLFRTLATQGMMPAEICTRMNDALSGEDNQSGMFVTFFLGLVDLHTGHLDFCNAGHNPPVLMKKRSGADDGAYDTEFLEMEPNAPIGLWPGLEYVGEVIADIRQQPLFIYTDGLNEAEDTEQKQFGDDHLLELLGTTSFESCQQTIGMLSEEVEKHRNGAEPNDDLTMMCVYLKNNDN